MNRPDDTFRKRVRAFRLAIGMTQEEVAEASGGRLTRITVNKIESGRYKAAHHEVRKALAEALGLEVEDADDLLAGKITIEMAVRLRDARLQTLRRSPARAVRTTARKKPERKAAPKRRQVTSRHPGQQAPMVVGAAAQHQSHGPSPEAAS